MEGLAGEPEAQNPSVFGLRSWYPVTILKIMEMDGWGERLFE